MAEEYRFFDNIEGDRLYNADSFAEYFRQVLSSGILSGGDNLQVYCGGTDMSSHIKVGLAWLEGYFYKNTSDLMLIHDPADGTLDRIDRVVLRLDRNTDKRYIKAFILKGTNAVSPIPPALTRTDMIYEISLAQVYIVHNTSIVASDKVTDERLDDTVCGLVDSLIRDGIGETVNYVNEIGYGIASGSANTYTLTLDPAPKSLIDGLCVAVKINIANTSASTLNVNGLGAKPIKRSNGSDVVSGSLKAGSIYTFRYNATTGNFILQGEGGGSGSAVASDIRLGKTASSDAGDLTGTMNLTNLIPANIKKGITIDTVTGDKLVYGVGDSVKDVNLQLDTTHGNGAEIWSNSEVGYCYDMAIGNSDINNRIVAVYLNNAGTKNVRRLSSNGIEEWSISDVGNATSVDFNYSCNYIFLSYMNVPGNKVVRKVNINLTEIWALTDVGVAIDITSGDIIDRCWVAYNVSSGKTIRALNSDGTESWYNSSVGNAMSIAVLPDLVFAAHYLPSGNKTVRKLSNSSNGAEIWANTDIGQAVDIAVDNNNVYVAYYNPAGTKNVRKLDRNGNELFGLNDVGNASGIAVDNAGNVYVAYTNAPGNKNVRKLKSDGTEVFAITDIGNAHKIKVDNLGGIFVSYNNLSGKTLRKLDGSTYYKILA